MRLYDNPVIELRPSNEAEPLVLAICDEGPVFAAITGLLLQKCRLPLQIRRVSDLAMAHARIAGGGVTSVLIDCSRPEEHESVLSRWTEARNCCGNLPIGLWLGSQPALSNLSAQGALTLSLHTPASELTWLLGQPRNAPAAGTAWPRRPPSTVIAVMGAKGGVGASTVAMNVAAALASQGSVVLAEIRAVLGSLEGHFHPGRYVRGLANAFENSVALPSLLWPAPEPRGLRVLFGPQNVDNCRELDAAHVTTLLDQLSGQADFIVADLAANLSATNHAVLAASRYLLLVCEPTATCFRLGHLVLTGMQGWEQGPASIGCVLVKRQAEGVPLGAHEAETALGIPVLKIIPPAPEICLASELAHLPLVSYDPDSLAAGSLVALSRTFHPSRVSSGK